MVQMAPKMIPKNCFGLQIVRLIECIILEYHMPLYINIYNQAHQKRLFSAKNDPNGPKNDPKNFLGFTFSASSSVSFWCTKCSSSLIYMVLLNKNADFWPKTDQFIPKSFFGFQIVHLI